MLTLVTLGISMIMISSQGYNAWNEKYVSKSPGIKPREQMMSRHGGANRILR